MFTEWIRTSLSRRLPLWIGFMVVLVVLWVMVVPFLRADGLYQMRFCDDFYYYLKIAVNWLHDGRPSFDGTTPTNGYHPLWMLIITGLVRLAGGPTKTFFMSLSALISLLQFLSYLSAFRLGEALGLSSRTASLCAAFVVFSSLAIGRDGMEVVLAIPLVLCLCLWLITKEGEPTGGSFTLLLGLFTSALVLTRLDTIILAALLGLGVMAEWRAVWSRWRAGLPGYVLGLLPLLTYLGSNLIWFGSLLPVSGQAKQLRSGWMPSAYPLLSFFQMSRGLTYAFIYPSLLLTLVGLLVLMLRPEWVESSRRRRVLGSLCLMPLLYYGTLAIRSDWWLWPWYFYPLVGSSVAGVCLGQRLATSPRRRSLCLGAGALFMLAVAANTSRNALTELRIRPEEVPIYHTAMQLQAFAEKHPGVYSMGDRAGTVGFLLASPVVQLEGLVMDQDFLRHIRQRDDLKGVLRAYHVDYYIASNPMPCGQGFLVSEPAQAHDLSPKMSGIFGQPLARFSHGMSLTYVFQVDPQ